uniref:hypothetical protein n=1 Tax=Shewanella sp. TaxID=50422 RepID=UPI0040485F91
MPQQCNNTSLVHQYVPKEVEVKKPVHLHWLGFNNINVALTQYSQQHTSSNRTAKYTGNIGP